MAQALIQKPSARSPGNLSAPMRQSYPSDGAFAAEQFVTLATTGGVAKLSKTADNTTSVWGLSDCPSYSATAEPYSQPFGNSIAAVDPCLGLTQFTVNVMTNAKAVGTGDATGIAVGSTYGLGTFGTAGYTDVQGLNVEDPGDFFKVVEILDPPADKNCRVVVTIVPAAIQ